MVAGGESKKGVMKIMKLFQVGCKGPVVKELVAEEASRVLLFCDDECDKAFAAKPIDKQLKKYSTNQRRIQGESCCCKVQRRARSGQAARRRGGGREATKERKVCRVWKQACHVPMRGL